MGIGGRFNDHAGEADFCLKVDEEGNKWVLMELLVRLRLWVAVLPEFRLPWIWLILDIMSISLSELAP